MRSHGRNNRRQRANKGHEDDRYLETRLEENRSDPYSRPHQPEADDHRISSSSNRGGFAMDREPSLSHSQRDVDWRRPDSHDIYGYPNDGHRGGKDNYDIDLREEDPWYARPDDTRTDWSHRYEASYSSNYPDSSWNPPPSSSYINRPLPHDHWGSEDDSRGRYGDESHQSGPQDGRRNDRDGHGWRRENRKDKAPVRFQSDSGWETRRRKAWDDANQQKSQQLQEAGPNHPAEDRSWEPAPSWKPSAKGNEPHNQQRRSPKHQRSHLGKNKNKKGNNNNNARHRRDWRNDDSNLNNWQKRSGAPSQDKPQHTKARRKHPRSTSRSRSRSPAESHNSHLSSYGRSRSRSVSPVSKRARRDSSPMAPRSGTPSDRGRPNWTPRRNRDHVAPTDRDHMWAVNNNQAVPGSSRKAWVSTEEAKLSPISGRKHGSRTPQEARLSRSPSPPSFDSARRRRSISSGSSMSTDRSHSRSPVDKARPIHRLPPPNSAAASSPVVSGRGRQNTRGKNGKNHGKNNESRRKNANSAGKSNANSWPKPHAEVMPPPSIIPLPHNARQSHQQNARGPMGPLPDTKADFSVGPPRIVPIRTTGLKPIGQASSSSTLKKFFPGEDDEMESVPSNSQLSVPVGTPTGLPNGPSSALSKPPVFQSSGELIRGSPLAPQMDLRSEDLFHDQPPLGTSMSNSRDDLRPLESRHIRDGISPQTPDQGRANEPRRELYQILTQVGEGTFGKVFKAQNTVTKVYVALKRIRMESEKDGFPVTAMREIKLLQSLRHENIVRLYEMMVSEGSVFMVFEYMDHDLTGVLSQTQFNFAEAHLKSLCHQMLGGLAYLHHRGVIHRDIKGPNILLNNRGELKLADFGLARFYQKRRKSDYTNRVITLWYRPPELLLGATVYGPEVDMWSAGCIMLELFTKKPVFQGNDEVHQLEVIYKMLGTPTPERWPGIMDLPWYELVRPQELVPNRFRILFKKWMSSAALDLAEKLLAYDPVARISANQALQEPYFTQEAPPAAAPTGLATLEGEWHELVTKKERQRRKKPDTTITQ